MTDNESFTELITTTYLRDFGIAVDFEGALLTGPGSEPPLWLCTCILELISNCQAFRNTDDIAFAKGTHNTNTEELQKAATHQQAELNRRAGYRISVRAGNHSVRVEDNFVHSDPETAMSEIRQAVLSPNPYTTKQRPGGCGIFTLKKELAKRNGNLEYQKIGRRIVASIKWQEPLQTLEV